MKVLFLCGVFGQQVEQELIRTAKKPIEYSANLFQEKIVRGFKDSNIDIDIVSAPFIGSFPNASSIVKFDDAKYGDEGYSYVSFNNVWGIRNISRVQSLKGKIKTFARLKDNEKLILIYSPHTPFVEAAVWAKKKDPSIQICMVVPDLPQYMNLNSRISWVYKFAKKIDISQFNNFCKYVDSYLLLTEEMKNKLPVGDKPYLVIEGIIDSELCLTQMSSKTQSDEKTLERRIVYTGKTNEKFGIKNLVDAFGLIESNNYRLIICGNGDSDHYISGKAKLDPRIEIKGQVTHSIASMYISTADVLVNPRPNNEEYTKYSFPSKNIEYLTSGNPVVAYMLDGVPRIYEKFMYIPKNDSIEELKNSILAAVEASTEETQIRRNEASQYFKKLVARNVVQQLLDLNFKT